MVNNLSIRIFGLNIFLIKNINKMGKPIINKIKNLLSKKYWQLILLFSTIFKYNRSKKLIIFLAYNKNRL